MLRAAAWEFIIEGWHFYTRFLRPVGHFYSLRLFDPAEKAIFDQPSVTWSINITDFALYIVSNAKDAAHWPLSVFKLSFSYIFRKFPVLRGRRFPPSFHWPHLILFSFSLPSDPCLNFKAMKWIFSLSLLLWGPADSSPVALSSMVGVLWTIRYCFKLWTFCSCLIEIRPVSTSFVNDGVCFSSIGKCIPMNWIHNPDRMLLLSAHSIFTITALLLAERLLFTAWRNSMPLCGTWFVGHDWGNLGPGRWHL